MSKLEEFIENNRDEIDRASPSNKVWENVEASLTRKKTKKIILSPILKWSAAAAVLVMVALGGYFIAKKTGGSGKITGTAYNDTTGSTPEEVAPFAITIAQRQEELKVLAKDQPELYQIHS